jgi:uncharacterized protein YkwD
MNTRDLGVLRPPSFRPAVRMTAALTAAVLAFGLIATATTPPATAVAPRALTATTATALAPDIYEARVQRLVNRRRANRDLPRLRLAACPDRVAENWSRYLALNQLLRHRSMTYVLNRCDARYAGETLGRGTMSPRRLVRMWMNSPAHRDVLLSRKARRIGVGATQDIFGRWVVAANFVRF